MQVLLIEDNPDDALLVREWLAQRSRLDVHVLLAQNLAAGIDMLRHNHVDVVLLDLSLPDSTGMASLMRTREYARDLPVIVLTGAQDEALAIRAVHNGAQDYLVKGQTPATLMMRSIMYSIERKRSESALKAALEEKEILLKEVHHRVKNNLQIISSLLNLQSAQACKDDPAAAFHDIRRRVQSMAALHEMLYRADDVSRIDMGEYLRTVAHGTARAYNHQESRIHLRVDVEKALRLGVDAATPCGLIVNELVANSLKHAFPASQTGFVHVHLSHDRTNCRLGVKDNGVGFPKEIDFSTTNSLGLQLVSTLVKQLAGKITLDRSSGTEFAVEFPVGNHNSHS